MQPTFRVVRRQVDRASFGLAQTYAGLDQDALLHAAHTNRGIAFRRSEDNGRTWREIETVPHFEAIDALRRRERSLDCFYLDPNNGLLVRLFSEWLTPTAAGKEALGSDPAAAGRLTHRLMYQVSRDGGHSWGPHLQLIERGPGYDTKHWARDVWHGRSTLEIAGTNLSTLRDGTILLPCYLRPTEEHKQRSYDAQGRPVELRNMGPWYFEALCLRGRWREDLSGIEWQSGGLLSVPGTYSSAGTCGADEPCVMALDDGRLFCIVRTGSGHVAEFRKRNIPMLRYCAVSTDAGLTWGESRPLTYTDGGVFYSPCAYSDCIRSSKTGKWYWVANILDGPTYGHCDPRHPLQIAEVDTEKLGIRREAVTVIDRKGPDDPELVRFSNFRIYEERDTGDFILLMTKSYSELTPGLARLQTPSFVYRIHAGR